MKILASKRIAADVKIAENKMQYRGKGAKRLSLNQEKNNTVNPKKTDITAAKYIP